MNGFPRSLFYLILPAFVLAALMISPKARTATVLVVNHTDDTSDIAPDDGLCADSDGRCTLRAAMQEANALAGTDTINFDLPGAGPHIIQLANVLPSVSESVDILNNSGEKITISGGGPSQPFIGSMLRVHSNVAANISNLGLTNAYLQPLSPDGFFGGAAISNGGTLSCFGVTIYDNHVVTGGGRGGAIYSNGEVNLTNSTISGNSASVGGGIAILNFGTILPHTFTGSTLTNNEGGGIDIDTPGLLLQNTIIAGNFIGPIPVDVTGPVDPNSSYNLIGNAATAGGLVNGVNNNQVGVANPGLGLLAANGGPTLTHALSPTSPAVDKGDSFGLITDQRGSPRPVDIYDPVYPDATGGDGSDIGAFEWLPQPSTKDQCKNGGWLLFFRANATSFKNQGDCIQYVHTGK